MGYQPYMRDLPEVDYAALQNADYEKRAAGVLKRATDVIIASLALIFLLPVLVPIALFVRLSDGGPAIFKQKRIGRNGREFLCFKFRSMHVDAKAQLERLLEADPQARAEWRATQKLENDPRILRTTHASRLSESFCENHLWMSCLS